MMLTILNRFDQTWFLILNQLHHPVMDIIFLLVTNSFFWTPLYIWLIFFIKKRLGWDAVLLFIFTIVISDQSSATWLKPFFAKYRPCYVMPITEIHLLGSYKGIYGFPSSHASNTYAFAMLFWRTFKTLYPFSWLFFIWATIVSYGRIYGGVHYPSDILFGAIVGCSIGWWVHRFYETRNKSCNDKS